MREGSLFAQATGSRRIALVDIALVLSTVVPLTVIMLLALTFGYPGVGLAVCAIGAVFVLGALRPPFWWFLPLVPLAIPFGTAVEFRVDGNSMPIGWVDFAGALIVIVWFTNSKRIPRVWGILLLLLGAWSVVTILVAADVPAAIAGLKVVLEAAILGFVASSVMSADKRKGLLATSVGLVVMAATVSLQLLLGQAGESSAAIEQAASDKIGSDLAYGRSNYLAALIVLGAMGLIVFLRHCPSMPWRIASLVTVPIMSLGLIVTGSKNQVLAIAAILMFWAILAARGTWTLGRIIKYLAVATFAVVGLSILSAYFYAMFDQVLVAQEAQVTYRTLDQRQFIWANVLEGWTSAPIAGVGIQNLTLSSGDYTMAHNLVLQVATETGLIGLILFLSTIAYVFLNQSAEVRLTSSIVVLGLFASGLAENTLRTYQYDLAAWLLLGSLVGMRSAREIPRGDTSLGVDERARAPTLR